LVGIQEFSRQRFSSETSLRSSAADYTKPERDVFWMDKLIEVKNYFVRDPLALATIYKFFPRIFNLFVTAIAATADYGYSEEDALNNQRQIIEQMFKSFGVDQDGKAVFKPVWAVDNFITAMKIEDAIKKIGWPSGVAPKTPDAFHLRLGASNFYVPPLSISVNTGFKTGSLTGGAIRQKSSPKFNAGYKETTIVLKLFFPNYEEIWGITAKDAAQMNLGSKFNVDIKTDFLDPNQQEKIDKFLSSLRGLIASFKYAPILPIRNHYLNSVFNITGVALSSMSVSTIPNFPFAVSVDLELKVFNHKPFLPMLSDFNQAVDWSRYRFYMGRAANAIADSANEEFLLTDDEISSDSYDASKEEKLSSVISINGPGATIVKDDNVGSLSGQLVTNIYKQWTDGNNVQFYIPKQIQSKFTSPDVSAFRTDEERNLTDLGRAFWEGILKKIGIDIAEAALYRSLDTVVDLSRSSQFTMSDKKVAEKIVQVALAGSNSSTIYDKVYDALAIDYISNNNITNPKVIDYIKTKKSPDDPSVQVPGQLSPELTNKLKQDKYEIYTFAKMPKGYLEYQIQEATKEECLKLVPPVTDQNSAVWKQTKAKVERRYVDAFHVSLYENFYSDEGIKEIFDAHAAKTGGSFTIKEWAVPMMKVSLDEKSVIVTNVAVTLSNNMAKMQLQMQDEPTFQYIGCNDSFINMSLTVFGEKELAKLTRMFDFLSGLARLEQAAGVIGFMGIKNILTALCGIKYVLPVSYNVDTIPGYPHVYNVRLGFVDFDIFQQKRENISSESQIALIKEFGTKRNPFLRLKQRWSMINTYPDMPLSIKDPDTNDHVGSLDPDFYFRSFEMFDNDVINNVLEPDQFSIPEIDQESTSKLAETIQSKENFVAIVNSIKEILISSNGDMEQVKNYLLKEMGVNPYEAMKLFRVAIYDSQNDTIIEQQGLSRDQNIVNKYPTIWKDMIENFRDDSDILYNFEDLEFKTKYGNLNVSEILGGVEKQVQAFNKLVQDSIKENDKNPRPSFDPDDSQHFGIMHYIPAADSNELGKIPAIYQTPDGGYIFGHSDTHDGRFYIAEDNIRRNINGKITGNQTMKISDTSCPDREKQDVHTGIPGAKSLDSYMNAYGTSESKMQSVNASGKNQSVGNHWQKMMMDSQYRDISGRMLRAFPTYMLWLIDDSNFFAGVKLFDNFYGLQSVIDFSIVQSEDLLGDTLVLRISNTYSKLSKPEKTLTSLINNGEIYNVDKSRIQEGIREGTLRIVDKLITRSLNLRSHMNSSYVVEIQNMRMKPGVRVHLRAGYGSNPNSLQTVFNGIVTEVDHGEIITIVAQSDAIELSPIINSTNKKGDSGKIDGGINTGLWMSEPRDLMIRLLSMGSSRTREAFAHATRGAVFSENKFGIRHFGSILYAPLTEAEAQRSQMLKQSVTNAFNAVGNNPITGTVGLAWNSAANIVTGGATGLLNNVPGVNSLVPDRSITDFRGMQSAGGSVRTPVVAAMQTLWANFSTQRDLEIFKRNIYPGNGIGVAQFLGGDLDDGWATLASIDESKVLDEKFGYLDRLSGSTWSNLIQSAPNNPDASAALEARQKGLYSVPEDKKAAGTSNGLATSTLAVSLARYARTNRNGYRWSYFRN